MPKIEELRSSAKVKMPELVIPNVGLSGKNSATKTQANIRKPKANESKPNAKSPENGAEEHARAPMPNN